METTNLAVDWFGIGQGLGSDALVLIYDYGIPLLCGLFVIVVGFRTREPRATIVAVIFAGFVAGLASQMDFLSTTTAETITNYDGGSLSQMDGDQ
ncbi:hypothetical protein [Streptomyces microflavus]|uniref:hypothetical protein n=1 Tax=Streptomyces microflavus TaxID=1919 RepID=UPI002E31651E|nr:hypothetical protein [Streptomyces microflavus]WTF67147.1 hypothetical protein OH770_00110 [Streptomyces microflavus]